MYKPTFNCEDDECDVLFSGLKFFFKHFFKELNATPSTNCSKAQLPAIDSPLVEQISAHIGQQILELSLSELSTNFVAGFTIKKIKIKVYPCSCCKNALFANSDEEQNSLIKAREERGGGWSKHLCYPTLQFAEYFYNVHKCITDILKMKAADKFLSDVLKKYINTLQSNFFNCENHKPQIISYIIKISIRTLVHAWCRNVNRILSGKDSRPYVGNGIVKKLAHEIFSKRKSRLQKGEKIL